jgi:hypothetical protein
MRPIAQLIDISTTPVGKDPRGELKSGLISLAGPCLTASLQYPDKVNRYYMATDKTFYVGVVCESRMEHLPCNVDYNIPIPQATSPSIVGDPNLDERHHPRVHSYVDVPGYSHVLLIWIAEERDQYCVINIYLALRSLDANVQI